MSGSFRPTSNVSDKKAGVLCYLYGVLFAIIFLQVKPYKNDNFVRFHAFQSLLFFSVLFLFRMLLLLTPRLERTVGTVVVLAFFTWVFLMLDAYKGRMSKLPLIGRLAERWAGIP